MEGQVEIEAEESFGMFLRDFDAGSVSQNFSPVTIKGQSFRTQFFWLYLTLSDGTTRF